MNTSIRREETIAIFKWADRMESFVLCLLLTGLILLSCVQIFLRTFLGGGLLWADPVLRFLVIWCGFLGGLAATGKGKHIAIDLVGEKLPMKFGAWLEVFTNLFCIAACAGLTWAAWRFWWGEWEYATVGPLNLPSWSWNTIYPLTFALMTGKYFLLFVLELKAVLFAPVPGRSIKR